MQQRHEAERSNAARLQRVLRARDHDFDIISNRDVSLAPAGEHNADSTSPLPPRFADERAQLARPSRAQSSLGDYFRSAAVGSRTPDPNRRVANHSAYGFDIISGAALPPGHERLRPDVRRGIARPADAAPDGRALRPLRPLHEQRPYNILTGGEEDARGTRAREARYEVAAAAAAAVRSPETARRAARDGELALPRLGKARGAWRPNESGVGYDILRPAAGASTTGASPPLDWLHENDGAYAPAGHGYDRDGLDDDYEAIRGARR